MHLVAGFSRTFANQLEFDRLDIFSDSSKPLSQVGDLRKDHYFAGTKILAVNWIFLASMAANSPYKHSDKDHLRPRWLYKIRFTADLQGTIPDL